MLADRPRCSLEATPTRTLAALLSADVEVPKRLDVLNKPFPLATIGV